MANTIKVRLANLHYLNLDLFGSFISLEYFRMAEPMLMCLISYPKIDREQTWNFSFILSIFDI